MVRITHKPRFPSLMRRMDAWFEKPMFPFSRSLHPWYRMEPLEELESSLGDYLDYIDRSLSNMWQFAPEVDIVQISHEKLDSKMFIT